MKEPNPFLEAALFYALRLHWPVFPIKPGQKHPPLTPHGSLDATTDEAQIRAWWSKYPRANVACRTGDDGGIIVLDVDFRHGGLDTVESLERQHGGRLRDTLRQTTGRRDGSYQLIYQRPPGDPIANAENLCGWAGVDLRGANGYILLPPSLHPDSKQEYVWDTAKRTILEEPINAMDDWLLTAIRASQNGHGPNGARFELPTGKIPHGTQKHALFRLGSSMRAKGCEYAEIVEAMWTVNEQRCEKPGPRKNIEREARFICEHYPAGSAIPERDVPPGPAHEPWPEHAPVALPDALKLDDVLDAQITPPEALIENLLPRRGLALLVGAQRSGKTIFATQLTMAILAGEPLMDNYRVFGKGAVIVFEKDDPNGTASFQEIFRKSQLPRGLPLHFYPFERIPEGLALGAEFSRLLEERIVETRAVMVVLDSYTALRPFRGRNAAGDIAKYESQEVGALNELANRLGCLILLIHHESVTARGNGALEWDAKVAGTYSITAASECQIAMSRFRDLESGAVERLARFRSRHMKDHQAAFRYNEGSGLFLHLMEGDAAPYYPQLRSIARHLGKGQFSASDMEEPLGISRATAFRYLAILTDAGALLREKFHDDKGGSHIRYMLSPDARGIFAL